MEINVNTTLPSTIPVVVDGERTSFVEVEYSWKPTKCTKWSVFGHSSSTCPKNQPSKKGTVKAFKAANAEKPGSSKNVEEEGWEIAKGKHTFRSKHSQEARGENSTNDIDSTEQLDKGEHRPGEE